MGSNSAAAVCSDSHFISFVVTLFFKSSLNQDETVAEEVAAEITGPSQLELQSTDGVACRHSVVSRGESEHKARTTNQLMLMSSVTKERNVDRSIRTESTESVTDWANKMGATGFFSILNTET